MPDNDAAHEKDLGILGISEDVALVDIPFPNFYVNNVSISAHIFDFAFTMMERLDPKNQTVKARIVMSPLHAKLMSIVLARNIQKWEAQHGKLDAEAYLVKSADANPTASTEPEQPPAQSPGGET
jgi:uncharacterized protein DUF3467